MKGWYAAILLALSLCGCGSTLKYTRATNCASLQESCDACTLSMEADGLVYATCDVCNEAKACSARTEYVPPEFKR